MIEQAEDTDWFVIQLFAGQTIDIALEGEPNGSGTLPDPVVAIYDQFANEVGYNDDGGENFNSLLSFTAPSSGVYYISAEAFGDATGSYVLSVYPGVADDFPGDFSSTAILGIGRNATGTIESAYDTDWFGINLNAGQPIVIRMLGSDAGGGTLLDPSMELYDEYGTFLDANDDDGVSVNSAIAFTPQTSGRYFVSAGAFSDYTGSYTLTAEIAAPVRDDYPNNASTSGLAQVNQTVYGEIEAIDDEDWFRLQLQPGFYTIDLEGEPTGMGTLGDPSLVLYNAQGVQIDSNDDAGGSWNSQLQLNVGAPSLYYLGAGAFGSNTGTYALTVTSGGGGK